MIQLQFGLPNRSFKSFNEASKEAMQPFYGGIHYRAARKWIVQGKEIGDL
jgi:hypothetical protein